METVLRASGLRKRLGGREVLAGVDLMLAPGTVTVVLGENGAGKTTLLRALAGELALDDGQVWVCGRSLTDRKSTRLNSSH